jgi:hypothetical protein
MGHPPGGYAFAILVVIATAYPERRFNAKRLAITQQFSF